MVKLAFWGATRGKDFGPGAGFGEFWVFGGFDGGGWRGTAHGVDGCKSGYERWEIWTRRGVFGIGVVGSGWFGR